MGRQIRLIDVEGDLLIQVQEENNWVKKKERLENFFWLGNNWEKPKRLPSNTVTERNLKSRMEQAIRLADGRLLINTRCGLFAEKSPGGPVEMVAPLRDITYMFQDSDGWIWEARFNNGVYVYSPDNLKAPLFHWFEGKGIAAFAEDKAGGIWIGSGDEGLYYAPRKEIFAPPGDPSTRAAAGTAREGWPDRTASRASGLVFAQWRYSRAKSVP